MTTQLLMDTYSQSKDAAYEAALAGRKYTQIYFFSIGKFVGIGRKSIN